MTPDQKINFFKILQESKLNNQYITVDEIANVLNIDLNEVKKPWHSKFKVSLALEHNCRWTLYAKEIDKNTRIK